jgi:outer membrane protein OmpA-like peptidoglycan-associated protein
VFSAEGVARTAKAVNYRTRGGSTSVDFVGASHAPAASGEAKVKNTGAAVEIEAEFDKLPNPQSFGAEYLTNVLWAVSPEGRVSNLGEVQRNKHGQAKIAVTSDLQVFGMVVTAEPYYAVRMPSDVIVVENETTKKTEGRIFFIDAKYELLKRGAYEPLANPLSLEVDLDETPLDVYQARNALEIAMASGAEQYAPESLKRAEASLEMANNSVITKGKEKEIITLARQAVQFAEDARALTVERQGIERERQRQEETAAARQAAEDEARRRTEAEGARKLAEAAQAKAEGERLAAELEAAKEARYRAEAEAARLAAEQDRQAAREAAMRAELQRKEAAEAAMQAELERRQAAESALRAEEEGERAREAAMRAEQERERAEKEKLDLRQQILTQLDAILPTRDTERGLVVNMEDVLFDVGKFDLRPVAREKLARLAGTVLAFPGLRLKTEGHTDNTGGEELNQRLSENRASAVRDYLVSQGIGEGTIESEGLGFTRPVQDNSTAAGRQANRRVEIIVSGEVIGTEVGAR